MAITGKYLYCFIKEKDHVILGSSSVAEPIMPVYTLPYKGVSAVVSDADIVNFEPSRKNILAHQRVMNMITASYSILPVAFGTVSFDKVEIEHMLADNCDRFLKMLDYFKNKLELGLRVIWNKDYFIKDIENDEIIQLKQKIIGRDEDEVLVDKINLGKLVEASMLEKKDRYIQDIYEPLKKAAIECKLKDGIPMKTVFSAYFLIEKAQSDEFDKKVEDIYRPYDGRLDFCYTGPWPPYNFVDTGIVLKTNN
jgi:hypothetical protein